MKHSLRASARRFADFSHRWLGVTVGAILVIAGLTGTLLAFCVEIERTAFTHLRTEHPHALPVSYQAVYQRLARLPVAVPGQHWRMEIPPDGGVITSRYQVPD